MTDEEARGNIIFDDDYLSPMTTVVPDEWSLAQVSIKNTSEVERTEYEVWYIPEGYVVMGWPFEEGVGYSYPTVKAFSDYAQIEQYIEETK